MFQLVPLFVDCELSIQNFHRVFDSDWLMHQTVVGLRTRILLSLCGAYV